MDEQADYPLLYASPKQSWGQDTLPSPGTNDHPASNDHPATNKTMTPLFVVSFSAQFKFLSIVITRHTSKDANTLIYEHNKANSPCSIPFDKTFIFYY
jgi:hypothetical protein